MPPGEADSTGKVAPEQFPDWELSMWGRRAGASDPRATCSDPRACDLRASISQHIPVFLSIFALFTRPRMREAGSVPRVLYSRVCWARRCGVMMLVFCCARQRRVQEVGGLCDCVARR